MTVREMETTVPPVPEIERLIAVLRRFILESDAKIKEAAR